MAIRQILLLGNENLYKTSLTVCKNDLDKARQIIDDLHDTMTHFIKVHGFGRAIAAPQIDEAYRIIYFNLGNIIHHFINPIISFPDDECFYLWDDCMSFPGLEVYLKRYKRCHVKYKNLNWEDCELSFEGDLSELFQHEYDHLDGILAVQRVKDLKAFRYKK